MDFHLSLSKDVKSSDELLEFLSFHDIFIKKLGIDVVLVVKLSDLEFVIKLTVRKLEPVLACQFLEQVEFELASLWLRFLLSFGQIERKS